MSLNCVFHLPSPRNALTAAALLLASMGPAAATQPRLDDATCTEMRLEKMKFVETGILADIARGPEWGKANFSPEKLREIELYIMLDEQLKFACRDAVISPDAARAGQAAIELEIPIAPQADPDAPAAGAGAPSKPAAKKPKAESANAQPGEAEKKPKPVKPKPAKAPVEPPTDPAKGATSP
ncbi:MAG: hypothetical protein ACKVP4_13245 [Hyphomicrobium sp.]